MSSAVPYDAFADIYDAWCESAPITRENLAFYVRVLAGSPGPRVELGVGNGRIGIEVAKRGQPIVGVDSSEAILELCRHRAEEAGVTDLLYLVRGDFRDFELPEPARLITLPFHSIGHLLTEDDRLRALRRIWRQLVPGGRFIFDHFIFDPDYPQTPGVAHLRAEFRHPESGRDVLLWETATRDLDRQVLHLTVYTDELDERGIVAERRYRRNHLAWLSPEQSRALLESADFEVETVYGDFREGELAKDSTHQVWVARRPPR